MNAKVREINKAINNTLTKIQVEARKNASRDDSAEGISEKSILIDRKNKIVGVSNVLAPHAPFIEFGTKTKVNIKHPITKQVAGKYQGRRFDFNKVTKRIAAHQNVDDTEARKRAAGIYHNGVTARPFFYPAVFEVKNTFMVRELKKAVRARK